MNDGHLDAGSAGGATQGALDCGGLSAARPARGRKATRALGGAARAAWSAQLGHPTRAAWAMSVSGFDGMTTTGKERRPGGHDPIASLWVQAAHDLRQPVQAAQLLAGALDDVAERDRLKRAARGIEAALQSLHEMLETVALLA